MPGGSLSRFSEIETAYTNNNSCQKLGPITATRIKIITFAILFMYHAHNTQGILQIVTEILVQEIVESFATSVEDAHIFIDTVVKRGVERVSI